MTGSLDTHERNSVNYISRAFVSGNKASGSTGRPVSNMVKHLRADIDDQHFKRFKALMAMEGSPTNDDFIITMLDIYERYNDGELVPVDEVAEFKDDEEQDEDEVEAEQPEPAADDNSGTAETSSGIEF